MATRTEVRPDTRRTATDHGAAVRRAAGIVGAVFLLVGILGFVPGVTTDFDEMELAGHESGAELFGIFQVSVLHNAVHLLFGIAGLAMARATSAARAFLVGGGVIYLALWIFGLVIDKDSDANFVPLNRADDWLHFGLGVGMVALGLLLSRRARTDRDVDLRGADRRTYTR